MPQTGEPTTDTAIRDTLLICASIVVILAGVRTAGYLLEPFLLAVFVALVFEPLLLYIRLASLPC